ncbi:uncharacterized protein LOC108906990 [Anoplophora glabripennis]|uniref:uncharacterized protein LOC108906990 n=1 Tax=Anoplophora glabripennis TaxID=217634 RepID=UPI000874D808|nr:uncharacterized protein LOC108906990 [Anoplophora glabripennis]
MDNGDEKTKESTCQILHLPECVLTVLFSYLDSTSLYQLTRTCRYFHYFITDPIFWRYIDARRNPNTNDKVHYCSDRIHEKTTHVLLKAKDKTSGLVPYNFFTVINPFKNIKVLALENQRFHGSKLTLKEFPPYLEELSLKGTHIKSSTYFFQHSGQNMQKLRVLILDQCQWVTCSFLMSVAKYESLEIISAIKCLRLHLNMIPYLNVARYGCKKLKTFDCRFTSIGHELLRTFYPKESLQSLYFQSLKSAEVDYKEYIFNQSYMRAESSNRSREGDNSVCDESLFEYINLSACDIIDKTPESVLYKDPYPECTCNCNKKDESCPPPLVNFDEYYVCMPPRRKSIKFVCQRHIQDVEKLSHHFREFFLSNQHQFYADVKASEVESEPGSSDSESDDNCGTCCMYGMGRSMILLSPGNNPGTIEEEVLELNPDEREQGGRVVSIFISTPQRDGFSNSQNNPNPIPSTSRSVEDNSINENLENTRNEAKRRLSEDKDPEDDEQSKSKRPRRNEDLKQLSDEAKAAEASELIESAHKMGKNVNEFLRNSMEICNKSIGCRDRGASTSRIEDLETGSDNTVNPVEKAPSNADVTDPGVAKNIFEDKTGVASTSKDCSSSKPPDVGESSSSQNSRGTQNKRRSRLQEAKIYIVNNNQSNDANVSSNNKAAEEGEPSRQPVGNNAPRTAIITIRNRERSRYVNPLFVQFENKHIKKKSRLRRLSLRGFRRITNVALDYIKNLKLDLIDLTYTSVTKEGIENFLAYNPNCRVIHPLYCICKPLNPF